MAIFVLLSWWYTRGWLWIIDITDERLKTIMRTFAVGVLLKTWFSPWKQLYEPSTIQNFFQIMINNAVSRVIGSIVRGTILFWALILSIVVLLVGLVSLVVWPLLPLMIIILPILTVSGVAP